MAQLKKILISIPEDLLEEADGIIMAEKTNRSKFIREAIGFYVQEQKKKVLKEQMIEGYRQMWDINLSIVKEWEYADFEQHKNYEEKLSERE